MARIRRTIGGLVLAVAAAAVLVVIPAQAQVRTTSTTTTSTTGSSTCDTITQTIRYIEATYDEPMETVLAAPWRSAAALYGCATQ